MPKYSKKKNGLSRFSEIPFRPTTAARHPKESPAGIWERLVERLQRALAYFRGQDNRRLMGRIHELSKNGEEISTKLEDIKYELSGEVDNKIYTFIETIVDPMLKELQIIQNAMHTGTAPQQAKAFKKYHDWLDKAEVWVQFYAKTKDKSQLIQAVIDHSLQESVECIKRDQQVIHDYMVHQIDNLLFPEEQKQQLVTQLKQKIAPYLNTLENLKAMPHDIGLDQINNWKQKIDRLRQKSFEASLFIIDSNIDYLAPFDASEEAHEHLQEVLSDITELETETENLLADIDSLDFQDTLGYNLISDRLSLLAETAHRVNLDLRLTSDLVARLQAIQEKIYHAELKLHLWHQGP